MPQYDKEYTPGWDLNLLLSLILVITGAQFKNHWNTHIHDKFKTKFVAWFDTLTKVCYINLVTCGKYNSHQIWYTAVEVFRITQVAMLQCKNTPLQAKVSHLVKVQQY